MLVDISDIKKDLNEEEKEIFDKVIKAMNTNSISFWKMGRCYTL